MSKYIWTDYVNNKVVHSDEPYTDCINNIVEKPEYRIAPSSSYCVLCYHDNDIILGVGSFMLREDAKFWIDVQNDPYITNYTIVRLQDKIRFFDKSVQEFENPRQGM